MTNISGVILVALSAIAFSLSFGQARAATATYVAPASLDAPTLSALSTNGDNAGAVIGLNQVLALLFDAPFATTRNDDSVSVYTVRPDSGRARAQVRFGVYNNGAPTFVYSRNVNSGGRVSVNNLFNRGCSAFGGCDYIEIITTRVRGGAQGAEVDYVDVNGQVASVTAPTPEPGAWLLMIGGFWLVAWRLKSLRWGPRPRIAACRGSALAAA